MDFPIETQRVEIEEMKLSKGSKKSAYNHIPFYLYGVVEMKKKTVGMHYSPFVIFLILFQFSVVSKTKTRI